MLALVTGATGFIGSHLVEALLAQGDGVRCLVKDRRKVRWLEGGVGLNIVEGDVIDVGALGDAIAGVDCVYHLAGVTRARRAQDFFRINAEGTRNLVTACIKAQGRLPRLVYVSSLAAVGPRADTIPIREDATPRPVSAYGLSKLKGEEEVLAARGILHVTVVRPGVIYGPRDKGLYSFARWVSRGLLPVPAGPPRFLSLCYVDDLVRAIIASSMIPVSGETYHLTGDRSLTWLDIGDMMGQAMGLRPRPLRLPFSVLVCMAAGFEVWGRVTGRISFLTRGKVREAFGQWVCDSAKARQHLGFIPCVSPEEGMKLTVQWYRSQAWI